MTITMKIEDIAQWGSPKRVETKNGPRNLRKAFPQSKFWTAWKSSKVALKEAGVSCGKDRDGRWEALWWLPLDDAEQKDMEQAQTASRATDAVLDVPRPQGLEYLPFQRAGIAYALDRPATLIGDQMGLGKTIQAIGIFNAVPSIKTVLIVCPASLRLNWFREFQKWTTKPVEWYAVISGGKKTDWIHAEHANVVIVNYDVLAKHRDRIDERTWDLLIVDECHYVKNPKAARTRAIFGWKTKKGEIKQQPIKANRKLFLTGTPIVNRPIELWPLVESIDPAGLGKSFFAFARKYCDAKQEYVPKAGMVWNFKGASNLSELQRLMRERFMVRRLKENVLADLPPKRRQIIELPANGAAGAIAEERRIYDQHREWIEDLEQRLAEAEAEGREADVLEYGYRIRQANSVLFEEMSKARHEVALAKIPHVVEHLESALEEGSVVCFAWHKDVAEQLAEPFGDRAAVMVGDTSMEERQRITDRFQAGELDLIVANMQVGGTGWTWTKSSHVVFAELDWVPGNLSQAEDRCHRIGQDESVLVQHLVLEDSLDATMAQTLIEKQIVIDKALDRKVETKQPKKVESVEVKKTGEKVRQTKIEVTVEEEKDGPTKDQIEAVREGLQRLAGVCDGAMSLDGRGFNKFDSRFGKELAMNPEWSPRQFEYALKFVVKYQRQLPSELVQKAKGE